MRWKLLVLALFFGQLFYSASVLAKESKLIYQEYTIKHKEKDFGKTEITIKEKKDSKIIQRFKKTKKCDVKDELVLDNDHSLLNWRRICSDEGIDFVVSKEGDAVVIKGLFKGEPIDRKIDLEGKYLHVYPKYSLDKFALSGMKSIKFWTFRRDELTLLPMRAKVEGYETIEHNGEQVEAVKVYYTIASKIREKFYNHNYYYRKSDGTFLKKEQQDGAEEKLVEEK